MNISYPMLLDGGLSNELERQGCNLNNKLWSAKMLADTPESIIQAHLSYLIAGANCITTASYQATVPGFMAIGYDRATAEAYLLKSVELAEEAIKRYLAAGNNDRKLHIAASIGPYGAYLADGSEYHGNYSVDDEKLRAFHLSRIKILDKSDADFFACETIPCIQEVRILAELLLATKKSAWISFSCKDDHHLNDGTDIRTCVELLVNHPKIFAIGVNCTAPKHISGLIKSIKEKSGTKKIIVYPNSGEVYNAESKTWLGIADPKSFAIMAKEWLALGTDILGGCCRIGPEHIKNINKLLISSQEQTKNESHHNT